MVGVSSPACRTPATRTSLLASKAMWTSPSLCSKLDMGRLLSTQRVAPEAGRPRRNGAAEGAGPLIWRAAPWVVTTGSLFVPRRTAISFSPSVLDGPRRCRPLVQAEAAGAVAEVSSPEERGAEPGGRGERRE